MTAGGLKLDNANNRFGLQDGHTYIVMVHVEGVTSNATQSHGWTNTMGWGGGETAPSPTNVSHNLNLPANFQGERECWYKFTISDTVWKKCTTSYQSFVAGTSYVAYNCFMIGWGYSQTGTMGTDIKFSNFRLYDITGQENISPSMLANGTLSALSLQEEDGKFRLGDGFIKATTIYEK